MSFAANYSGEPITEPTPEVTAQPTNDPGVLIAMGALRSTCHFQGRLQHSVTVVSSCFVDGFVRRVTFYQTPNCPPNQPCIQIIELAGSVLLDCDNNVLSVDCAANPI